MTAIVQLPSAAVGPLKRRKAPWWVCPSSRELSLRSEIRMGYSTIGSRLARNKHSPLIGPSVMNISEKELTIIQAVLARAREMERINELRSGSLMAEYDQLKQSCRGDGEDDCVLCGYDPLNDEKKLSMIVCDKCGKKACTTCYKSKRLMSGGMLTLCKLCYDYQELWCKTGAWMTNKLPEIIASDKDIEHFRDEGRRGTRASVDFLAGIEVQLDKNYLTQEEEEDESDEESMKMGTLSSYSNVKFSDMSLLNTSRTPTPLAMMSDLDSERGRASTAESRRRAVSSDNRAKLKEIRDRVNKKVTGTENESSTNDDRRDSAPTLATPSLKGLKAASFDSQDSDFFEPIKIHESMEEKDSDLSIAISMPVITEDTNSTTVNDQVEAAKESKSHSESDSNDEQELTDDSEFEFADVELPRGTSFSRFGNSRTPIRMGGTGERQKSKSLEREESEEKEVQENTKVMSRGNSGAEDTVGIDISQPQDLPAAIENTILAHEDSEEILPTQNSLSEEETLTFQEPELPTKDPQELPTQDQMPEEMTAHIPPSDSTVLALKKQDQLIEEDSEPKDDYLVNEQMTIQLTEPLEAKEEGNTSQTTTTPSTANEPLQIIVQSSTPEVPPSLSEDFTAGLETVKTIEEGSITDHVDNTTTVISTNDTLSSPTHTAGVDDDQCSSSSSASSSPRKRANRLRILNSSGEEGQDIEGAYRWRRRNATKSAVGKRRETNPTSSDNEGESSSMSKDNSLLSKREKARLAAKRLRESKAGVLASSRSREFEQKEKSHEDNDDQSIPPSPRPRTRRIDDNNEQSTSLQHPRSRRVNSNEEQSSTPLLPRPRSRRVNNNEQFASLPRARSRHVEYDNSDDGTAGGHLI